MVVFMVCQLLGTIATFLNHSFNFSFKLNLPILSFFFSIDPFYFGCHLHPSNVIMDIFKFLIPKQFIHNFWACHLQGITFLLSIYCKNKHDFHFHLSICSFPSVSYIRWGFSISQHHEENKSKQKVSRVFIWIWNLSLISIMFHHHA